MGFVAAHRHHVYLSVEQVAAEFLHHVLGVPLKPFKTGRRYERRCLAVLAVPQTCDRKISSRNVLVHRCNDLVVSYYQSGTLELLCALRQSVFGGVGKR